MLRVFLVIDDYNELIYLQSLLKKLGLDVEGVQNQKKYADMSLGFNPHILITSAKGKKVDGLQLTQSLYRKRGLPKVIALKSNDYAINVDDYRDSGVDEILDSPVSPRKLILSIANLGGIDETALLEKYSKIKGQEANAADDQSYIASYDENGQPVESVQKVKQSIETITRIPGFPLNASDDLTESGHGLSNESGGENPRFPLRQGASVGEAESAGATSGASQNASGSTFVGSDAQGSVATGHVSGQSSASGDGSFSSAANQTPNNNTFVGGDSADSRGSGARPGGASGQDGSAASAAGMKANPGGSLVTGEMPTEVKTAAQRSQRPEKTEREKKYDLWATNKVGPLPPKHFVRDRILDFNKKIRRNNVIEDIDQIEDERKNFVKALFRRTKP